MIHEQDVYRRNYRKSPNLSENSIALPCSFRDQYLVEYSAL